jgi:CubicO group peptidase (beta-lactamase class C family)
MKAPLPSPLFLLLLSGLALAACSEPPPPAPPKPSAVAPAPIAAAPAPEAPKAPEPAEPKADPNKALAAKVKQALEDPGAKLPSGAIDVTAADGKVTLWGALPSERDVRRAGQVAGKVDGVKTVDNQLKVVKGS